MNTLFAVLSLLTYIKGLGGSFNSLFNQLGIGEFHGPTLGFLLGSFLLLFFSTSLRRKNGAFLMEDRNRKKEELFCLLYLVIVLMGMFVHTRAVLKTPIDVGRADMLPAIQAEIHAVMKGQSPYKAILNSNGSTIQHGYMPMLWMSYLPFEILGLDLRWINLLAQFIFYLLLLDAFLRNRGPWPQLQQGFWTSGSLLLFMISIHLFSKQGIRGPIDLHTGPFWLFSSLFYWAVLTKKQTLSLWIAPLLVLCREPAVLLVLPYVLHLFFTNRRSFLRGISIGTVVGLLVTGPFLLTAPADFFRGIFFYSKHIYQTPISDMMQFYGFSGILFKLNLLHWQQPLQLLGTVVAIGISLFKSKLITPAGALALGGIAYLNIIIFASMTYPFLYIELVQLVLLLTFATQRVNPIPKNT